jgi:hypothetical protein
MAKPILLVTRKLPEAIEARAALLCGLWITPKPRQMACWRLIGQSRMEPLTIIDVFDEGADRLARPLASCLSVFMKLSARALSNGSAATAIRRRSSASGIRADGVAAATIGGLKLRSGNACSGACCARA